MMTSDFNSLMGPTWWSSGAYLTASQTLLLQEVSQAADGEGEAALLWLARGRRAPAGRAHPKQAQSGCKLAVQGVQFFREPSRAKQAAPRPPATPPHPPTPPLRRGRGGTGWAGPLAGGWEGLKERPALAPPPNEQRAEGTRLAIIYAPAGALWPF